ncbi:MAG TPA: hypothetical protein VJI32_00625 [Candidatus Nanoarchaeia archaeon]|nr:hypothetical protein [Candidatus Nanoarchaeia archaeon]
MKFPKKKIHLFTIALVLTFIITRIYLWLFPHANFNLGPYNIHHLYVGAVLLILTVIMMVAGVSNRIIIILAGISSALILDQLVFLTATDGADLTYLGRTSLWGAVTAVLGAVLLAQVIYWWRKRK